MGFPISSIVIIIIVLIFVAYLIFSQVRQRRLQRCPAPVCPVCRNKEHLNMLPKPNYDKPLSETKPQITNVTVDYDNDPYADPIKKQDLYNMYDPLTYPQLRLPRDLLDRYNQYYEENGSYPPFNKNTHGIFDNPVLNGVLIKQSDDLEPFADVTPSSIPLFRVKSSKNTNRYFYYIIDQKYPSKIEVKIPLDHVKINGIRHKNSDFYGIPEIFDGDIIENIPIYPNTRFKVVLYKTYHFP